MYILLISRGIPSVKDPQWGCFEFDQARALVGLGHKVVVACLDRRFRFQLKHFGISEFEKDRIVCFESLWFPSRILRLFGFSFEHYVLKKQIINLANSIFLKYGKPDIIYSHYIAESCVAIELKNKFNIPFVVIEHSSLLKTNLKNKYVQYLGSNLYSKADKVLVVSKSLKTILFNEFGVDSVVVHNMVGVEFKYNKFQHKDDYFQFVSVGSLIHRKGFDLLIEAFFKSGLTNKNVNVVIIGEGEERFKFQNLIQSKGLAEKIQLVGAKNKKEIIEILQQSNVFVLPSRNETFGVVYIEAMMVGLPVIATACGGPEEFVKETDGLVIPVNDAMALVNALKYMFENCDLYDREKIARDCKNRFSSDVIVSQLNSIFESVINEYNNKVLNK